MGWHPELDYKAPADEGLNVPFRQRHEEFYGRLMELHEAVDNAGSRPLHIYWAITLVAYSALWSGWYQRLPGLQEVELNNVWSYAGLFAVGMLVYAVHKSWLQRWHYRRHRQALRSLAAQAGLSRYQLLARLADDEGVKQALAMIKRDRWESGRDE